MSEGNANQLNHIPPVSAFALMISMGLFVYHRQNYRDMADKMEKCWANMMVRPTYQANFDLSRKKHCGLSVLPYANMMDMKK